jgi:hypothetical protein
MNKRKPFNEITEDSEYLSAVGMGPDVCPILYKAERRRMILDEFDSESRETGNFIYVGPPLLLQDIGPANKWSNFGRVLSVIGPVMDQRNLTHLLNDSVLCADFPHIATLEAFYDAHDAQENET